MSVKVMTLAWSLDLPDSQKIVLLALADCANDEGHCWPSMASLSRKCSKGERTVQGVIKQLVEAGHVTREEVRGKGCNYWIHPRRDCAPQKPRPARTAPPQGTTQTPAAAADKPSRTIKLKKDTAHELPDDWMPKAFGAETKTAKAMASWPPGEIETRLEHFRAHHRARGNKFKDWDDAWTTWVLNGRKFDDAKRNSTANRGASGADLAADAMRKLGYAE